MLDLAKELRLLGNDAYILCSGLRKDMKVNEVPVVAKIPETFRRQYVRSGVANTKFIVECIMGGSVSKSGFMRLGQYGMDLIKNESADVYHLNSFASSLYFESCGLHFVTNHENRHEYNSKWGAGFYELMCEIVRGGGTGLHAAAALMTPSKYYAHEYSRDFNLSVVDMGAGIRLNEFDKNAIQVQKNRPNADAAGTILFPARFDPYQKGHDIALKALAILKKRGLPFLMEFTGMREDYRDRFKDFFSHAKDLGVSDLIQVAYYDEMMEAYMNCDIVISPERYCSYGLSISEALSLGVPTVLSDIPTYREIGEEYGHAYFFEKENPEALANSIILASAHKRKDTDWDSINFRIQYDIRDVAKKLTMLYRKSIENKIALETV